MSATAKQLDESIFRDLVLEKLNLGIAKCVIGIGVREGSLGRSQPLRAADRGCGLRLLPGLGGEIRKRIANESFVQIIQRANAQNLIYQVVARLALSPTSIGPLTNHESRPLSPKSCTFLYLAGYE
ncbi:MAG TPA: hypothetical protein VNT79_18110 [Phycisphaerae bacterium]|nr:hypothetical protein [Phycisphaerae bacterium]